MRETEGHRTSPLHAMLFMRTLKTFLIHRKTDFVLLLLQGFGLLRISFSGSESCYGRCSATVIADRCFSKFETSLY